MHAPARKVAPYIFLGQTTSLCATCHELVPAKIIVEDGKVLYQKRCHEHGVQKSLVSTDAEYYKLCRDYLKPGDRPLEYQSRTEYGCPYDCGLCPDHEQHSCLALIDVNEACNLTCPVCFSDSSTKNTFHRPLDEIGRMMDALVASEGEPDLLQISGGEPTIHPEILEIIAMAKARPIRHIMLNTNGIRIAREPEFAAALAQFKPGFEVYLQFDSLKPEALKTLRGADLTRVHTEALENLERHGISTTLVAVIKRGVNEDEIGALIDFALQWDCVRGVTYQPVQDAGRNENFDPARDRVVLSEIRRRIIDHGGPFGEAAEQSASDQRVSAPRGRGETVLVIEDDTDLRELAQAMLERLGYRVLAAGNAVAGLELLESETAVDLMLVDVQLPGGVSGLDLAEQVMARSPGNRILFMSGYARPPGHAVRALPKGAEMLPKPFYRMDLAQRVRAVLDS